MFPFDDVIMINEMRGCKVPAKKGGTLIYDQQAS